MTAIGTLDDARYVNLETFRKNGTGVQTPVWAAPSGDELVIFTNGNSYKVKRLRRNPAARIAACGARGALKGPWHEGTARLVEDAAGQQAILAALRRKDGWQMVLADWGARLGRTKKNWAFIAVRLNES
ncbi:MAG: PPOX class F420-dependent oxidoreductase [Polyangiales bacterium]